MSNVLIEPNRDWAIVITIAIAIGSNSSSNRNINSNNDSNTNYIDYTLELNKI